MSLLDGIRSGSLALVCLTMAWGGCSSDSSDNGGCTTGQVEVAYLGGATERTECHPIPAACGAEAKCADQACTRALYELCQAPAIGVGCSDTFQPAIVSCNES